MPLLRVVLICWLVIFFLPVSAAPPGLPEGLVSPAPGLPEGLSPAPAAPSLPPGLSNPAPAESTETEQSDSDENPTEFNGFVEYRYGRRVHDSGLHDETMLNEARLHIELDKFGDEWNVEMAADALSDRVATDNDVDLETGAGWLDLRKLNVRWQVAPSLDLRVGRQVITWGTGDLVFLNDMFPKDYRYWMGRDIEYIKAPSDALRLSWYNDLMNVDLVYTPRFDSDRFLNGERLSLWNGIQGQLIGRNNPIPVDKPDAAFDDDEFALRLFRNFGSIETALYGFDGFSKSPGGFDSTSGLFLFPRLRTFGASLRAPLGPGIVNLEIAYWQALDDKNGDNPLIDNGENRYLLGYEWEAWKNFTVGIQYYAEQMRDYGDFLDNLPIGANPQPRLHEIWTLRLTRFMLSQTLKLSWFSYYTAENGDWYARPEIHYQVNDRWAIESGANGFGNRKNQTDAFLGQFEENSNVYIMIRYSFSGHR